MIRVTIWNEFEREKSDENIRRIYPEGIHAAIADFLECEEICTRTATLDEPECGLTEIVVENTDVLIWWGHVKHHCVSDEVAERIQKAVLRGMGIIFLHSSHNSKPMMRLLGTSCNLRWHEIGEKERIWVTAPSHPIVEGIDDFFELEHEEMYGEFFDIPKPDELVFIGWFESGNVFRSGCCFKRGLGKIFYFQPGHEAYPIYYNPTIQQIIRNAVKWAKPIKRIDE